MIEIRTPSKEFYNDQDNQFIEVPSGKYTFEHSLISLSKWESITCRPFLSGDKTDADMFLYFECMCLDKSFKSVYLSQDNIHELTSYVNTDHTATRIKVTGGQSHKIITSEVIYAMMIDAGVPFSCEKWNLQRLLILINVVSARRNPKKMSQQEVYKQNNELNALRRAQYKTKG